MKTVSLFFIGFFSLNLSAQISNTLPWTWMSALNSGNNNGVYGTMGTASASNYPGGREGGCMSWTDASGNLWLFGGYGYPLSGGNGLLNDLWKYNPTAGTWTWVNGSNSTYVAGVYGTKGIASASNHPGSRYLSNVWSDNSGNLWLFGGQGDDKNGVSGSLNDLWKYNIVSGMWTWMSGDDTKDNTGVYGTMGTPALSNKPGGRQRFNEMSGKVDASGNLWLFGGSGYGTSTTYGNLNDLWKYNINTGNWVWISGDNTVTNSNTNTSVYGTLGTAAASNKPCGRDGGSCWLDTSGKFWVFGGGYDAGGSWNYKLNDLWKYDPSSGYWTWMSGDNISDQYGSYGTMGTPASSNKPGARLMQANWLDNYGNLWVYGGYGFAATGTGSTGFEGLSDLWKYDPLTNQWTWMKGDNSPQQVSTYGTLGVSASTNKPGNRSGDYYWIDGYGNLWLFGGLQWGSVTPYKNDLWKLVIPQPIAKGNLSSCQTLPTITINSSNNNTWVPIYDSVGNVAAEVNGNSNSLGTVSTFLFTKTGQCREDGNHKLYINRNLHIAVQNAPSSNVGVRFYILDAEMDSLRLNFNSQGQQSGAATIAQVDVFKNNDTCRTVGSQTAMPLSATTGAYFLDNYMDVSISSFSSFYFANKTLLFLLPVTFKSFDGKKIATANKLQWEVDCHSPVQFYIERSFDGRSFNSIGNISALQTDCNNSFSYTDLLPGEEQNYYRIKAIASDGKITYSTVIMIPGSRGPALQISTASILIGNSARVEIGAARASTIELFLTDMGGRLIRKQTIVVSAGSNTIIFDTGELSGGVYLLSGMNKEGRTNVIRLVKQ